MREPLPEIRCERSTIRLLRLPRADVHQSVFLDGVAGIRDDEIAGGDAGDHFDLRPEILSDRYGPEVYDVIGSDDGHAGSVLVGQHGIARDAQSWPRPIVSARS